MSSWQEHCESSVGSFRWMQAKRQAAANPQTKPTDLGCESACRLFSSTPTVAIYYYYSAQMLTLILPFHRR